jgi:hypothetical protein
MKIILAVISGWRLCNMMLDQDARLPFSARLFRVVAWLSAAGIAFSAFCLSVLYVVHCARIWL